MKISERFFQFPKRSCIAVVDRQIARFFFAYQGFLSEGESLRSALRPMSRRLGFFLRRGHGRTVGGSANRPEGPDEELFRQHLRNVAERLFAEARQRSLEECYLVVPEHEKSQVSSALHPDIRRLVILIVNADLVRAKPSQLVERITEERRSPTQQ